MSISERLIKLKEKIAKRTSDIDKNKGRLSILYDDLKKAGFKNIDHAKIKLEEFQLDLEKKIKSFNLKIERLERKIDIEDNKTSD